MTYLDKSNAVRALICLALALTACAAADRSGPRPPPLARAAAELLEPGDSVRVAVVGDGELAAVVLDRSGAVRLPFCGRVVLAGLDPAGAEARVGACLTDAHVYTAPPAAFVMVEHRAAAVTVLVGPGRRARRVEFEPGLTLVPALLEAVSAGSPVSLVQLIRHGVRYTVDVEAIATGERTDEPLAPGDRLVIDQDLPLRPAPTRTSTAARPFAADAASIAASESCDELTVDEFGLRAAHKGERHPRVVAVRAALAKRCSNATGATLEAACLHARETRAQLLARGYGPAHPDVRAIDAKLALCPPLALPPSR